jgi:hypothetical protein
MSVPAVLMGRAYPRYRNAIVTDLAEAAANHEPFHGVAFNVENKIDSEKQQIAFDAGSVSTKNQQHEFGEASAKIAEWRGRSVRSVAVHAANLQAQVTMAMAMEMPERPMVLENKGCC